MEPALHSMYSIIGLSNVLVVFFGLFLCLLCAYLCWLWRNKQLQTIIIID